MTLAQNITRHFKGDWHGSYGCFPTPGHSAADRGMTVKDVPGAPDGVLINTMNGGDPLAVKDECRRVGLLPEFEPSASAWRETGCYEYVGPDGTVLYRTVRRERLGQKKEFVAQRPDGRGGWANGIKGIDRVLYRLPDIMAADPAATVYLTEGERKADKLASWGLVATAVAFGAKGWRQEYADALKGRTVAILPDNDDEGRGFAEKARASILAAGGHPLIVELPGLPPKGDVIDWTGTADDLRALTEAALNQPAETFEIADLGRWARTTPTPKAFVMAPYIPREDVVIVTGDGGTNKSTLALQISACAAAGKPMLGMDVAAGPALYVTAEDDNRENHWRLAKIANAIGTTLDHLAGRLHIVSLRGRLNNELATFEGDGKLRIAPAYNLLRATIEKTGAKLVTLDNVAHLFAGNENDRSQVTAFINLLYQLCGDLGVTILLIAHRNKSGDSYSGSTAWLNAVRSQVLLERTEEDQDVRRLSLGKANYARQGEETMFRWHDFALVRDEDLAPGMAAEIAANVKASADNAIFLACLNERNRQHRQVSEKPTAANYAPKQFEGMPQAKGLNRKRLEDAMDRLYRIGAIERGFLYRDTAEGKDIHGLREVVRAQPETLPETSRKQNPESSGDPQESTGNTPPIPKGISDAAHGAAAPSHEGKNGKPRDFSEWERTDPITFAADDDSDPAADAIWGQA
jgi:RecA-family ATPase